MKRAVLVGGGHAHLYTLKRAREFAAHGYELDVVAPDAFWYSGLATGMLGGIYPPALDQVDIAALTRNGGGRFVQDRMVGLDLANRAVRLEHNAPLSFDALSLNLGSECLPIPGSSSDVYAIKPIRRLCELRRDLEQRFREAPAHPVRIAIGGGGVTAFELAGNLARLAANCGGRAGITIYDGGAEPLRQLAPGAAQAFIRNLERRGVAIRRHARIVRLEDHRFMLADGGTESFDLFVNATGLVPAAVVRSFGLPTTEEGALIVGRHLNVKGAPAIFGGGDCIALEGHALPRIGVYAIRQAPVLFRNLLATLAGAPLQVFKPQKRFLIIMTVGDGSGLATRGSFWWHGRSAFLLKDWIDRRFLHEYQAAARQTGGATEH